MMMRGLLLGAACAPMFLILGCPGAAPPEAVLAGDWVTDDAEQGTVYIRFDENGQVVGFAVVDEQDGIVLIQVENATTTVDGDDVTITVPTVGGTSTFAGTLSADQNSMTGDLTAEIEVTGDITVIIPQGEVTFDRVEECGDAFCDPGLICVNNECVECENDDDCAEGETCTDGACGAGPECDSNDDCEAGEVCTDGACVPDGGGNGGDPVAGQMFYEDNGCAACHAADGTGGIGPNIQAATAQEIFDNLSGADSHPITVAGITMEDAEDVAAWLNSL